MESEELLDFSEIVDLRRKVLEGWDPPPELYHRILASLSEGRLKEGKKAEAKKASKKSMSSEELGDMLLEGFE